MRIVIFRCKLLQSSSSVAFNRARLRVVSKRLILLNCLVMGFDSHRAPGTEGAGFCVWHHFARFVVLLLGDLNERVRIVIDPLNDLQSLADWQPFPVWPLLAGLVFEWEWVVLWGERVILLGGVVLGRSWDKIRVRVLLKRTILLFFEILFRARNLILLLIILLLWLLLNGKLDSQIFLVASPMSRRFQMSFLFRLLLLLIFRLIFFVAGTWVLFIFIFVLFLRVIARWFFALPLLILLLLIFIFFIFFLFFLLFISELLEFEFSPILLDHLVIELCPPLSPSHLFVVIISWFVILLSGGFHLLRFFEMFLSSGELNIDLDVVVLLFLVPVQEAERWAQLLWALETITHGILHFARDSSVRGWHSLVRICRV